MPSCYDCPADPIPGQTRCARCAAALRERVRRARAQRVASGRCVYCTGPNDGDTIFCRLHREYNRRLKAVYNAKKRADPVWVADQKKKRAARVAARVMGGV